MTISAHKIMELATEARSMDGGELDSAWKRSRCGAYCDRLESEWKLHLRAAKMKGARFIPWSEFAVADPVSDIYKAEIARRSDMKHHPSRREKLCPYHSAMKVAA